MVVLCCENKQHTAVGFFSPSPSVFGSRLGWGKGISVVDQPTLTWRSRLRFYLNGKSWRRGR